MNLEFVTLSKKWDGLHIRKNMLEKALSDFDGEIAIALSTDAHVHHLNRDYRGKDKPTNVLSFPNETGGDVILAIETIRAESKAQNKPLRDHIEHLIIHGALHCMGYDHENDRDANEMEALEIKICDILGFHPYQD